MTMTDRVRALFLSRPNEWVDGRELAQVGGYAAWRTRVSEIRQSGWRIDNEVIYRPSLRISRYRYVPNDGSPRSEPSCP